MLKENHIYNTDCMEGFKWIADKSIDLTLTDIPYNAVNRNGNGFRNLDKGNADILTFDLMKFLEQVVRVTKNNIVIFCGFEQFSTIFDYLKQFGMVRTIVWEKSNPSPMNGQLCYVSGVEIAVYCRLQGCKTFNANCKNTVFKYPCVSKSFHPTEKNNDLLREIISDLSNVGELVLDPCSGSGSTCYMASHLNRKYIGFELDKTYCEKSIARILRNDNIFNSYNKEV